MCTPVDGYQNIDEIMDYSHLILKCRGVTSASSSVITLNIIHGVSGLLAEDFFFIGVCMPVAVGTAL